MATSSATRSVEITLFGATGFTGQHIARELAAVFEGTFALAGRDRSKLETLAASLAEEHPRLSGRPPKVIVADVNDATSLRTMAEESRVVISTVGPFRRWGEPVVKACLEGGADYLDISGEPEFIERIELEYGQEAARRGLYLASAMAFDSVPGDLGALFTMRQFQAPARCTLVDSVLTIRGGPEGFRGHFPTYESAVYGFAAAGELRALRKKAAATQGKVDLKVPGPKPPRQSGMAYDSRFAAYTFPFMGADASVIRRSMTRLVAAGKPAAHVAVSVSIPSRWYSWVFQALGAVFAFLASREWGRQLLLQYPRLFSNGTFTKEGPSAAQEAGTTFTFTNIAKGYSKGLPSAPGEAPDVEIYTRVSGPEPGYIACSSFIVAAAALLVEERAKAAKEGGQAMGVNPGVHTPASLLGERMEAYLSRLRPRGITFERIDSPRLPQ